MPSNFLRSPILPGTPIPHHEHRRLMILLIVFVIVAIVIGLAFWWSKPAIQDYTPYQLRPRAGTDERVTLSVVEAQEKKVEITEVTTTGAKRIKLTPAQAKAKADQIKQLSDI